MRTGTFDPSGISEHGGAYPRLTVNCRRASSELGRSYSKVAVLTALCLLLPIGLKAQAPGFLGYVLNSSDGTVSIFAAESDDSKIGNSDHLISTIGLSNSSATCVHPFQLAATPDGKFAFVSCLGNSSVGSSVWEINVQDPTKPTSAPVTLSGLGAAGGIAVTQQPSGTTTIYKVWIADSDNCLMHVLSSASGYTTDTHEPLGVASTSGTVAATCGSNLLTRVPQVIATPDQTSAVFAIFNYVEDCSSGKCSAAQPYVYALDPQIIATSPVSPLDFSGAGAGFSFGDPISLTSMQDSNGDILLFIGDTGVPPTEQTTSHSPNVKIVGIDSSLEVTTPDTIVDVSEGIGTVPLALTTNNVDGLLGINDDRADTAFYLFVGNDAATLGVYPIDCGSATAPSDCSSTSSLTVGTPTILKLSDVPSSLAAIPSSYGCASNCSSAERGDGRASIIYVTETGSSEKPIQLVLGEGPGENFGSTGAGVRFGTPCIIGATSCGSPTVAGGQVYDTAVPVGSGPQGIVFGPLYLGSPALTWVVGFTTTFGTSGGFPYTPLQRTPPLQGGNSNPANCSPNSNSGCSSVQLPMYVNQGISLANIGVQALSMVSTLNSATLSSQISVQSLNSSNYGCAMGKTTCAGPSGPEVQSTTITVDATDPPNTGAGDVTTISFTGTPNSFNGCTSDCVQASQTNLKTMSLCALQVNGGTTGITITQGTSVTAALSCTGVVADTLVATLNWGDTATCSLSATANGATPVSNWATNCPSLVHTYNAGGTFTITASVTDTTDPNNQYSVTVNNTGILVTVNATYAISGTISGPGGNGATVALTGTSTGSTTANSSGVFSFSGLINGSYTVTPSKTGFSFSPASQMVTINNANVTSVTFSTVTYTISGTISGAGGNGASVSLSGAATANTTADSSGNFSFAGLNNGSYTVTPLKSGFSFTPASKAVTISNANVTSVTFTSATSTTYSISGAISGAGGKGAVILLTGTVMANTTADSSGNFSFAGLGNGSYTLTPTNTGYVFTPTSKAATISSANVTGVNFAAITLLTCSFAPFNPTTIQTGQQLTATLTCQGNAGDSLSASVTNWGDGSTSSATTASVSGSGSATFTFTHTYTNASVAGTAETITASVTDTTNSIPTGGATTTITVTLAAINPVITPSATSLQVTAGQSATVKLGFQGNAADAGAVLTIAAQNLPQGVTLSYSPNPFTLDQNGVNTATITITTTGSASAAIPITPTNGSSVALILSLPGLMGMLVTFGAAKSSGNSKRVFAVLAVILLVGILGLMSACGTNGSSAPLSCSSCTPAGTSSIVVTATSQHPALQSSVTLQLQVGSAQ